MISKNIQGFYKPNIGLDPLDQGWAGKINKGMWRY